MFNKKRIVVAVVFILFMFCFITFAGGTPQNQAIATRNVTFIDSYNNAELSAQRVIVGEDAEVPEDPRHNGLIFVGWYLEEDRETRVRDFTNVTDNITVVALYGADLNGNGIIDDEDDTYTVTFVDSTNNAVIARREVLVGMSAVPPTAPTHVGLTFTGWDASYTNVRNDRTINAIYRPASTEVTTYTVRFIDNIDERVIAEVTVEEGLTVNAPVAPEHEGYVFVRWDGNLDDITEDTEIRGIYAVDSNNNGEADETETKYTVSYRSLIDGTQNEAPRHENSFLTTERYTVLENTFALDAHVFLGWTTDRELASEIAESKPANLVRPGTTQTIATSNVIYYAVWAEDANGDGVPDYEAGQKFEVSITYGYGENKVTETKTVLLGTKFEDVLPGMDVVDPTNEDDYAFDKWVIVDGASETTLTDVTAEISSDVAIEAIYGEDKNHNGVPDTDPSERHYDVTFKTDSKYAGLLGEDEESSYTVSIVEGASIGDYVPAIKELDDDKIAFEKWTKYDGLKNIDLTTEQVKNTIVTSDMTFDAVFGVDNNNNGEVDDYEEYYDLTIEYVNSVTKEAMFDAEKLRLVDGEDYEVASPVPSKGKYTIDPEVVTGVFMKENDGDVITVTYTPESDENGNGIDDSAEAKYTVTFVDYDDRVLSIQSVLVGLDAKAPMPTTEYTKDGYTYTFDGTWNEDFTNVQKDITNIAPNYTKTANEYTVTYVIDSEEVGKETVAFDSKLANVPAPTKEGHTLSAWKLDGKEYDTTLNYTQTKNITLHAEFVANKYTVTYDVDGTRTTEEVTYGTKLSKVPATAKPGYTFLGWFVGDDATEKFDVNADYTETRDITLTAKYEINTFTVTYVIDGEVVDTEEVIYNEKLNGVPSPSKEGYTLGAWKLEGTEYDVTSDYTHKKDITLTNEFVANHYTVTYVVEGEEIGTKDVTFDDAITHLTAPSKSGYTFVGWFTEGNVKLEDGADYKIARDVTLTARYTANVYTVTYDVDGTTTTEEVTYGTKLNAVPATDKVGYTFTAWVTADDEEFDVNAPYTVEGDTKIIATFRANEYTVTYVVEGQDYVEKTVKYDSVLNHIPAPTKTGYTFDGWYTDSGDKVEEGKTYTTADNMTLTAKFVINKYDVTVTVPNGVVDKDSAEVEYNRGTEFTIAANEFYTLDEAKVVCTNATATLDEISGILSISAVTDDTVCTVTLESDSDGNGIPDAYEAIVELTVKNATTKTEVSVEKIKVGTTSTVSFAGIIPSKEIYSLARYTVTKGTADDIAFDGDKYVVSNITEAKVYTYELELSRPVVELSTYTDETASSIELTVNDDKMTNVHTVRDFENGNKVYPGYTIDHATISCNKADVRAYLTNATANAADVHIENVTDDTVCVLQLQKDEDDDGIADEFARVITIEYPTIEADEVKDNKDELKKSQGDVLNADLFTKRAASYETEEAKFTFSHWTMNGTVVSEEELTAGIRVETSDMAFKAEYTKIDKRTLTVEYEDSKGNVFKNMKEVSYTGLYAGDTVKINVPAYEHYTTSIFVTNGTVSTVVDEKATVTMSDANATVTVVYTADRDENGNGKSDYEEKLTVRFYDDVAGKLINSQEVLYGESAIAPADPSKSSTAEFDYTFASWDKTFDNITADLDVYATYTSTKRSYTVRYFDYYGTEITDSAQTLEYGSLVTVPTVSQDITQYGDVVKFIGWSTNPDRYVAYDLTKGITGNTNLYASYKMVNSSTATLYGLDEIFIRQEDGSADARGHFTEVKAQISIKDDENGTLAKIMSETKVGEEGKLAVGGDEIRKYLTEESLSVVNINSYDIYVLKYCVTSSRGVVTKAWHLDYQINSDDVAVYRKGNNGLKVVSYTQNIESVTRFANGVAVETIDAVYLGNGTYTVDGFGINIVDTLNGRKSLISKNYGSGNYYVVNYGNGRTKRFYWDIYAYNNEGY